MDNKESITIFLKSILVGIGAVAPGLSGSIMLVIFNLYERVIEAIDTIFKDFKKNVIFLLPIFSGLSFGILIFSRLVNHLLINFEMQTRFTFLGLVLGTIPLLKKQVQKKGFEKKYYIFMLGAFLVGVSLFLNPRLFNEIVDPNVFQKMFIGVTIALSSIAPGVDSAVMLSALGLYRIHINAVASLNFNVLIPAGVGLTIGILLFSNIMNKLLKKYYTLTFSIIFGLFISIIPRILNESCYLSFDFKSLVSILLLILGFISSYLLSKLEK